MSDYDHGPLRTYEVTWRARPPEAVQGHSVQFSQDSPGFPAAPRPPAPHFRVYGMLGGHWRMILMGLIEDVTCIRDVTEQVQALEAMVTAPGSPQATG